VIVFDDLPRWDEDPATHSEGHFAYLNRSARPEMAAARALIERWFNEYPSRHQVEMRSRLRSDSNFSFQSAFLELAMHRLLLSTGAAVELHPQTPSSQRRPDFLIEDPLGARSYVEPALVTFLTREEMAGEARKNAVYDILNKHVQAPDWFLWLEISGAPSTPPPGREIARFLNERLSTLSHEEVSAAYQAEGPENIPEWVFTHDQWHIRFRPIPRRPDAPRRQYHRPLGMFSTEFRSVAHRTPIRNSILSKANAYGELEYPFLLAIQPLEPIDDIDIGEALLGKEQFIVSFPEATEHAEPQVTRSRRLDGAWTLPSGPRNTRISGVLILRNLHPWAVPASHARLYHNPWASLAPVPPLTRLHQAIPVQGRYHYVDGVPIANLLASEP
jgi:hypothetical protein